MPDAVDFESSDNTPDTFPGFEASVSVMYEPIPTPGSPPVHVRLIANRIGLERLPIPLKVVVDILPRGTCGTGADKLQVGACATELEPVTVTFHRLLQGQLNTSSTEFEIASRPAWIGPVLTSSNQMTCMYSFPVVGVENFAPGLLIPFVRGLVRFRKLSDVQEAHHRIPIPFRLVA